MRRDAERALELLKAMNEEPLEWMAYTIIPGKPHSKARPRFTRNGRTYQSPDDKQYERETAAHLADMVKTQPLTGNVSLACVFFRPTRHRIDTDNMLKHICDSANGVLWVDDAQVTGTAGITEYDPDEPRTVVAIGSHKSTMERGTDSVYPCAMCGALIMRPGQPGILKKACSEACSRALRGMPDVPLSVPVQCANCAVDFVRRTSSQRFCGHECRMSDLTGKKRAAAAPFSNCLDCGAQLAHRRGGRCRDCWRLDVADRVAPQPKRSGPSDRKEIA